MSHTSQSGAYSLDRWPQSHGDVLKRLATSETAGEEIFIS